MNNYRSTGIANLVKQSVRRGKRGYGHLAMGRTQCSQVSLRRTAMNGQQYNAARGGCSLRKRGDLTDFNSVI